MNNTVKIILTEFKFEKVKQLKNYLIIINMLGTKANTRIHQKLILET
jgi:hypothetical protein